MGVHLVAGLVQGFQRCAGQLELTAGFEGHAATILGERDRLAGFEHRLPAETCDQTLENRPDAAWPLIGQRPQVFPSVGELLVLGADAPGPGRFAAGLQVGDQLPFIGDRGALGLRRSGHARLDVVVRTIG